MVLLTGWLVVTQSAPLAFSVGGEGGVGFTRPVGDTVVLGLDQLVLADPGRRVQLLGARVEGSGMDPRVARNDGVRAYEVGPAGGIGAITADELDGRESGVPGGWTLAEPAGVVIRAGHRWGLVLVVTGLREGRWSSDGLVVDYLVDGKRSSQRFDVHVAVCVADVTVLCESDE
ncbi:hypothetical protein [Arthrobacter sp. NEB 688]|uniref:hypothetical protein n=1 Tax=Arthrobacter sp. NEB 688 TaxID=904039 RepID=UPI0015643830|nr:hypothetical protein [Arthrobacter sp. NEB 688]QKE84619.1 hypothetical protein HL663_12165 [Arthrobacter sp. NEB 688]